MLFKIKNGICFFILLLWSTTVMAQSYNVPSSGTQTITVCSGTIYDPGGTGSYSNNCSGTLVIQPATPGCHLHLSGNYNTESCCDRLYIYDGVGTSGTLYGPFAGQGNLNVVSQSGPLTLVFTSDGSVTKPGFELQASCGGGCNCGGSPTNLTLQNIPPSMHVSWDASTDASVTRYYLEYGFVGFTPGTGTGVWVTGTSYDISNLLEDQQYEVHVYFDCGNDSAITTEAYSSATLTYTSTIEVDIPSSGTQTVTLCDGIIYDPGGTANYPNSCSGMLVVHSSTPNCVIRIHGSYVLENNYDKLYIYEGAGTNGTMYGPYTGNGSINLVSQSSTVTFRFTSDGSVTKAGFALEVSCTGSCECGPPANITAQSNTSGMHVSWDASLDPTVNRYFLEYGPSGFAEGTGTGVWVTGTSYDISDLTIGQDYDFRVYFDCGNDTSITTEAYSSVSRCMPDTVACIDLTSLSSPNIICQYGSFSNPYHYTGVQDNGWQAASSRHTINFIEATDPRTGDHLNILPPCESYSVRLGNWQTGAQAESITYNFHVDTNEASILLLKYAAVLEDPAHDPSEQPRFKFELLDQNNNLIDPTCGAADYIANQSLGWNAEGDVLWKDWTTVGTDLTAYHGQNIRVRLTTYDCDQSGHFGYAYFNLNCAKKNISVESCGQTTYNTYSAPSGFAYNWYYQSAPNNIISTSQMVTVPSGNDRLCCRVISLNNPNCYFTLWTSLTSRYPMADFTVANQPCSYQYDFDNQSFVSSDELVATPTGESCQAASWDFGDGTTSEDLSPTHQFPGPGSYSVTLVAKINNALCTDTITSIVTVLEYRIDTTYIDTTVCEQYVWDDNTYTQSGTYMRTFQAASGCDSIVTLRLTALPPVSSQFSASTCDTFFWNDQAYTQAGDYVQHLQNVHGCDSAVTLHLSMLPPVTSAFSASTCDTFRWNNQAYTQTGDYVQHFQSIQGCDSIVTLHLTILPPAATTFNAMACDTFRWNGQTYTQSGSYVQHFQTTQGCDSAVTLQLTIHPSVATSFEITDCDSYTWNGQTYTQSGNYIQQFQTIHGCDSVVTLHLTLHSSTATEFADTNCLQYVWNGQTYTQSGDYVQHFQTVHGCDSVVTLHLAINNMLRTDYATAACDSFTWNEQTYTQSGDYEQQFTAATGCDSVVTLHLIINPTTIVELEDVACEGKPYLKYGFNIPAAQTIAQDTLFYVLQLQSCAGCDSTVKLHLTVADTALTLISSSTDLCDDPFIELHAEAAMPQYRWSTGETTSSIVVSNPGYYSVTVSEADCAVSSGVTIEPCVSEIILPNTITPSNQDNLNDYFFLNESYQQQMFDFAIRIYDRWGNVVFASRDKGFRWGGEVNGKLFTNTMYSYVIQYKDFYGESFVIKGSLLVL